MSHPTNDDYSLHPSDEEASIHGDASDPGAAPNQPRQQQQQVIQYGNSKKRISTGKDGVIRILPPITAAEIQAVEKERKAKNILLMAIPKEHMRRFHGMDDTKEIWEAIRTRFGGLEKGYDRFQQLFTQLEAYGAEVSTEDANHKLLRSLPLAWVFEQDIKGASKSSSSAQNVAFVSQSKSSTNKVKSGSIGSYSTFTPSSSSTNILEQGAPIGFADKLAMVAIRMKKFYKKAGRRVRIDGRMPVGFDKKKIECFNCHNTGHFAMECTAKGTYDGKKKRDSVYQDQNAGKDRKSKLSLLAMDDGNKDQLEDFEEFNGGSVTFGGSKGQIIGKGRIRVGNLDFDNVSFVKELGHFNLFSISQICDKHHKIENYLNHKVKIIRSDNGTEFKNRDMLEFCRKKGIKQEYSNARTPEQNKVAERMNRTLIEAARTILADSLLPTTFWAEAVSTACYILNRVRVTKPQNKTPYELLFGQKPIISYIRPFGYHVTILDTLSVLGKFDGKCDEGFLVGYSLNSKAFR
ncbi:retrovirus-related pol polyprotein from transposon TNT 1-94, partial [Tanacetum coccineum]